MPTPYSGREFTFTDPDGTVIRVRGFGNQFAAVFETLEGFSVVKDERTGYYHYATVSDDGSRLLPSGPRVGAVEPAQLDLPKHARPTARAARAAAGSAMQRTGATPRWVQRRRARKPRTPAPPVGDDPDEHAAGPLTAMADQPEPVVGSYAGLCLLIRFPDVPDTIPAAEVANYCNQPGYRGFGNNGSVRDYFAAVSDGRLDYTNVVPAYITAKRPRDHYTDPSIEFGTRARQLVREGLAALKAQGFDFNALTADSDGYVRALNVFYVGPTVNDWSEGLWPHSWALDREYVASSTRTFRDYQITNLGSELTLGTFCHENGHMIADFPDLYDYGYQSSGVGNFCLMCDGGSDTNPVQVCAYLKNQAGWTTSIAEARPGTTASLRSGVNDFLIHRRSRTEYFIIENRQRSGRDAALPDSGIAIWHADETGSNDNEAMDPDEHYECSLEQADGRFDLEKMANAGDAGDLYAGPQRSTFGGITKPSSRWWDGSASGLEITDISASGPTMSLSVRAAPRVKLANLKYGVRGNADVRLLQAALNAHQPGLNLPTTGNYLKRTDEAVRRCQAKHGFGSDPVGKSFVGKRQAAHLGLVT